MALVSFLFYAETYGGTAITEETVFARELNRAEAFLGKLTFGRIRQDSGGNYGQYVHGKFETFSDGELSALKMGLCGLVDAAAKLSQAEQQALAGNTDSGNVKSRSSGGESFSYESAATVYTEALADTAKKNALFRSALMEWVDTSAFRHNPFYAGSR